MAWFKKVRKPIAPPSDKASRVPEGLWVKCPGCSQVIYNKDLAASLSVCPKCAHHFRISATEQLLEPLGPREAAGVRGQDARGTSLHYFSRPVFT